MVQSKFSKSLKPFRGTINSVIKRSVNQISFHFKKKNIVLYEWDEQNLALTLNVKVSLPPRGNYKGIDIRKNEPIILLFNNNYYPHIAPRVYSDRLDFPKDQLSHLYVAKKGKPPAFCLIRGNIDEWYAGKEIKDLIFQAQSWLSDAASGSLVEDGDQFDPIRLEGFRGTCLYDHNELSRIVNQKQCFLNDSNFALGLFLNSKSDQQFPSFQLIQIIPDSEAFHQTIKALTKLIETKADAILNKIQFGLIVWNKALDVNKDYFINLPNDFNDLKNLAQKVNINLNEAFRFFFSTRLNLTTRVPLIIAIKRPKPIIGYSSDIQFLNLFLTVLNDDLQDNFIVNNIPVSFQAHQQPLTVGKAREISNFSENLGNTLVVGAGAIGSKVIMHLARNGHIKISIIDNDSFSSHNLVRHSLLYKHVGKLKSTALREEIKEMYKNENLDDLKSFGLTGQLFLSNKNNDIDKYSWLFDFTASKNFQDFITTNQFGDSLNICRGSILDSGNLGLLLIEGKNRNPRIDDLKILTYNLYKENSIVAEFLQNEYEKRKDGNTLVNIGVGCNSETTILPDEKVSLHAASFTNVIKAESGREIERNNGLIFLNYLEYNEVPSIKTYSLKVNPLHVFQSNQKNGWEVRIIPEVLTKLKSEMEISLPNETGGVLIGQINKKTKCIHVTDIILAPTDSESNEVCFFRGIDGLPDKIDRIKKLSGQTFGYIGEWHTHPMGPKNLSSTDIKTVRKFRREFKTLENPIPVFLIIATPDAILPYVFE